MGIRANLGLLVVLLSGCGFDFGDPSRPPEAVVDPITVEFFDGGTDPGTVGNSGGCVFVPCGDPYGTSCGWVCPEPSSGTGSGR